MRYPQKGELCEENMIQAGISGIAWKPGHACFPGWVSQWLPCSVTNNVLRNSFYHSGEATVVGETDRDGTALTCTPLSNVAEGTMTRLVAVSRRYLSPFSNGVVPVLERAYLPICTNGHWELL